MGAAIIGQRNNRGGAGGGEAVIGPAYATQQGQPGRVQGSGVGKDYRREMMT